MSNLIYIKVSGTWKQADAYYVKVSNAWKTGSEFNIKVSSDWEGGTTGGGGSGGLPTTAQVLSMDFLDFTLPAIAIVDAKAAVNSVSMDVLDFTLPVVGKAFSTT